MSALIDIDFVMDELDDNHGNPAQKRSRQDQPNSSRGAAAGKANTHHMDFASPLLDQLAASLTKRAAKAREAQRTCDQALTKLKSLRENGQVASSLRLPKPPKALEALLNTNATLKASYDSLQQAIMDTAISAREEEKTGWKVTLDRLLDGSTFSAEAASALQLSEHSAEDKPHLSEVIANSRTSFVTRLRLQIPRLAEIQRRKDATADARRIAAEKKRLEEESMDARDLIKVLITRTVKKELAASKLRSPSPSTTRQSPRRGRSPSPHPNKLRSGRGVHFQRGRSPRRQSKSRSPSRSPSRSSRASSWTSPRSNTSSRASRRSNNSSERNRPPPHARGRQRNEQQQPKASGGSGRHPR